MDIREAVAANPETAISSWHTAGLVADHASPGADCDRAIACPQSAVLMVEIDGVFAASCMVDDDGHQGWVYYVSITQAAEAKAWPQDHECGSYNSKRQRLPPSDVDGAANQHHSPWV